MKLKFIISLSLVTAAIFSSSVTLAADNSTPVQPPAARTAPANTAATLEPANPNGTVQTDKQPHTIPANISTMNYNTVAVNSQVPAFQTLERIETIVYGEHRDGGLLLRINDVERVVFGRELPGSLTERQTALLDFLERGTNEQPSVLFKISIAEWAIEQKTHPTWGLIRRVDTMEALLEGKVKGGPIIARLERLLSKLLPEGLTIQPVELPKDTIVKSMLLETLTVKNVKVGDIIILGLHEPIMVNNILIAPKGSRVFGHITKVKPPRSFGRPSEINMLVDSVEVLSNRTIALNLGEEAKRAMEVDAGILGATGTSIAGAILLGPVGLAGGFLIRGNDKQLKEGTIFYVQTSDPTPVFGYPIPQQITPITTPRLEVPQGTKSAPKY